MCYALVFSHRGVSVRRAGPLARSLALRTGGPLPPPPAIAVAPTGKGTAVGVVALKSGLASSTGTAMAVTGGGCVTKQRWQHIRWSHRACCLLPACQHVYAPYIRTCT